MTTRAEREANKLRKRAQRERERAAKGPVEELTVHDFWKLNVSVANQDRIAELRERQEYVFDLVQVMTETIEGDVDLDQPFVELIAADVAQHGICEMQVYLLEFWKDPDMLSELTLNEPTKTFVRYGIVTGVPGHRLYQFQEWLKSRKSFAVECKPAIQP